MEIRRAKNTWRFDPVDQAYTLVTGNRRFEISTMRADAHQESQLAMQDNAIRLCKEMDAKNEFLGVKGERGDRWVAFPSPTPLVFVEEEETPLLDLHSRGALGAHEVLCPLNESVNRQTLETVAPAQWCNLLRLFFARARDLGPGDREQRVCGLGLRRVRLGRQRARRAFLH